jgi:hypothetical protein
MRGRYNGDLADGRNGLDERAKAGGMDAVVVGNEDTRFR